MKAAAIYLRVSTEEQSTANQKPDCEQLCKARGWSPLWFTETASGATADREQWRSVLEHARRGELAAVVFWSIDRIGRNRLQVVHDLEELGRWKVAIVSHQESFLDLPADSPFREMMIRWWAWLAQHERQRLIERTKAGQARARAEGRLPGRPKTPTALVVKILALHRQTSLLDHRPPSPTAIARSLGIPRSTVRDVLAKNPSPNGATKAQEGSQP
jgi:DNA invertase Pin-like site-specific DNA recombinase